MGPRFEVATKKVTTSHFPATADLRNVFGGEVDWTIDTLTTAERF